MTTQAKDTLTYRNNRYLLTNLPLGIYLNANQNILFDDYTTANYRGYQANWELADDNLYITELESSNYTYYDIFKTNLPTLADWYTGTLQVGFGNYQNNERSSGFENYLWFNIEKGKVIDTRILKDLNDDYYLQYINFGIYKNQKVKELLHGKITLNEKKSIELYITAIIEYFLNQNANEIIIPKFTFNESEIELIKKLKTTNINFDISYNKVKITSDQNEIAILFSSFIEKIFSLNFLWLNDEHKTKDYKELDINKDSILLQSDYRYLEWALKNVDSFAYPPLFLINNFTIKKLVGFKSQRLSEIEITYELLLLKENFQIPEEIIEFNKKKFEKIFKVYFDKKYNKYFYDLSKNDNLIRFQDYLDESLIKKISKDSDDYEPFYSSGDWLIDAAGTDDDETMNDVYWNLD